MGIFSLLALPIKAPFDATIWLAHQVEEAALRELNDPVAIKRALAEAEARLEAGDMAEEEFEELEDALLEQLRAASALAKSP
ncbi:MAG: gas vesicle protein GvpG [Pseudomonadota bacterium]